MSLAQGSGPDPATALPSTDTIQAVSGERGEREDERGWLRARGEGAFVGGLPTPDLALSPTLPLPSLTPPPRRRPALPPLLPRQFLEDNERLIQAVAALFAAGRGAEAGAYQARLHANLVWLAAVADCSGAGGVGGDGG